MFSAAVDYGRAVSSKVADAEAEVTARARLLLHLNPRGRGFGDDLLFRLKLVHPSVSAAAVVPCHFDEVDLSTTLPSDDARTALKMLASAVILLTGEERFWPRGRELLGSGAWLLCQGMAEDDRRQVRPRLPEAFRLWRCRAWVNWAGDQLDRGALPQSW